MRIGLTDLFRKTDETADEHSIGADMVPSPSALAERGRDSEARPDSPRRAPGQRGPFLTHADAPIRDA